MEESTFGHKRFWLFVSASMMALIIYIISSVSAHLDRATAIERLAAGGRVAAAYRGPKWLRAAIGDKWMRGFEADLSATLGQRAGDVNLASVGNIAQLRALDLVETNITDVGMSRLHGHPSLESLYIFEGQFTEVGLRHLPSIQTLRSLALVGIPLTDETLQYMSGMTQLRDLELSPPPGLPRRTITSYGLAFLTRMSSLRQLTLNIDMDDSGMEQICKIATLETLRIDGSEVSEDGLLNVCKLSRLKTLSLGGTGLTERCAIELGRILPSLVLE